MHNHKSLLINALKNLLIICSKVRVPKNQGVSPRTGNPVKGTLSSSVRDVMLVCDDKVVDEDFKVSG